MKNIIMIFALTLAGCGFSPLYDEDSNIKELASINVQTHTASDIPEKFTLSLQNFLEDELGINASDIPKTKTLEVSVSKSTESYETQNNTENRKRITLNVSFKLKDISSNKILYQDKMIAIDSFKVAESTYSALLTEEETSIRMIKEISNEIKLRILRKLWV